MNTKKNKSKKLETPNSKLQKSSVIFMQLGLILALLAVYFLLEHKSIMHYAVFEKPITKTEAITYVPDDIIIIRKQPKKVVILDKDKPVKVVKPIDKIKLIDNNDDKQKETEEDLFKPTDNDVNQVTSKPTIDLGDLPEEDLVDEEPVDFIVLEETPSFFGCKGSNEQKRKCFNKKIKKHIQRHFNVDLAQDLGLSPGKKRINVQFIINKKGEIEGIKTAATHIRLKKEAARIIKKLPKMKPGKQRNKPVNVKFNLPIYFNVED